MRDLTNISSVTSLVCLLLTLSIGSVHAVTDSELLRDEVITGESHLESDSFWQCNLDSSGNKTLSLRFWNNAEGALNVSSYSWVETSPTSLELHFPNGKTTLQDIRISEGGFDAVTGSGEYLECKTAGRIRGDNTNTLFEDDRGSLAVNTILNIQNQSSLPFGCSRITKNGTSQWFTVQILNNSVLSINGLEMQWHIDNRNNLVISDKGNTRVWDRLTATENVDGGTLMAFEKGEKIECAIPFQDQLSQQ